ncbi:hypothetical protein IL38_23835 [Actinopolyspora erythraea]|uniref:Uncharacterized protein n=1 Tax=Actinopolyspora erythraea TaxID=414996 RepID=A0ABR4WY77_9ACTN|nr:hypothetical protein [Actinopolyspora erythraea]KGI79341.1 hypothetical protein IL38_23835 [Actinopolyspora erythraea]
MDDTTPPAWDEEAVDGRAASHGPWDVVDPTTGTPRLLTRRCATCIYSRTSPVEEERRDEMVAEAAEEGTAIICHSTLPHWVYDSERQALCRGYWDASADSNRSWRIVLLRSGLKGDPVEVDPPDGA